MAPEFDDLLFAFIVVFLSLIHALEDFADVSHVKDVVGFCGRGQEVFDHLVVNVNCCLSERFTLALHLLEERLEFSKSDGEEDLVHILFTGNCVVDCVELTQEARRDFGTTSSRLAHGGDDLEITDVIPSNYCSIASEPELVLNVLADKLKGGLRAVGIFFWHVKVVNKAHGFGLAVLGHELIFCSTVVVGFDHALKTLRGRTR